MGAAPAYQHYPERSPQRAPRIHVVPGGAPHRAPEVLPASVPRLAILLIAVLVLAALLAFTRVGLSVAAVMTEIDSNEISSNIETAQDTGNDLEVSKAYLSNSTNVKQEAAQLGMEAAEETTAIELEKDVVSTDSSGNLSLALSIATASELATSTSSEDAEDATEESSEATDAESTDSMDTESANTTDTNSTESSSTTGQSATSQG